MGRAIKALIRKTFGKNHSMRAQASVLTLIVCVGFLFVVYHYFISLFRYVYDREPKMDLAENVVVVNAPDSFKKYVHEAEYLLETQITYKEWDAYYDVFTFSSWMQEEKAYMVVVFPEDFDEIVLEKTPEEKPEILTYCSSDHLEYTQLQEDFLENTMNIGYLPYIQEGLSIPLPRLEIPDIRNSALRSEKKENIVVDRFCRMVAPLAFFVAIMYVCMLSGMNAIAGEKERGTFAALLMSPISRMTIVLGNYLGVLLHALIPVAIIALILLVTVPGIGILGVLFLAISLAIFMSALTILISCMSQSIVSAQTTFLPIFLIVLVACVTCMQSTTPNIVNLYIPIYGQFYGIGDCLMNTAGILPILVSSVVTILLAGVCLLVSERLLQTETFTVAVETKSEKELRKAAKIAKKQKDDYVSRSRAEVFGYKAKKRKSLPKFLIGHAVLPLALLSLFQPLAMIPAILDFMKSPKSMSFIRMFKDMSNVTEITDAMEASVDLFSQFMQNRWFIFFMGVGYWAIIGIYILLVHFREKNPLSTLGFASRKKLSEQGRRSPLKEYLLGLVFGLLLISSVYGLLMLFGQVTCHGFALTSDAVPMFLLYILMWLPQGATEEIMMRGYMLPRVASRLGVPFSIFFSSMCFSLMHAGNAGVSFLALFNLAFIAAFFAAVALKSGHIYTVCAMHTMWNFCQGNVFGLEVSGNAGNASLLHSTANSSAKDILTGGGFGPEGGLCVTIVIAAAFAIFFLIPRISRRKV